MLSRSSGFVLNMKAVRCLLYVLQTLPKELSGISREDGVRNNKSLRMEIAHGLLYLIASSTALDTG